MELRVPLVGGKDSNFYVGPQAPFTNKNTSEEQKMFGRAPQHVVMQRNVRRYQSERVILLGPDECQSSELRLDLGNFLGRSSELRLDLGNFLGRSSNEDRLQVCKEGTRTQKYLGKNCYHRIKCTIVQSEELTFKNS